MEMAQDPENIVSQHDLEKPAMSLKRAAKNVSRMKENTHKIV